MTADNFENTLEELLTRKPFRAFTIELNTGRRFEIDHPRATVIRQGVAVFVAPGPVPIRIDHDSVSQIIDAPAHAAPPTAE
jgi:hypothetical protein